MFTLVRTDKEINYLVEQSEFAQGYPVEIFSDPACYDNPVENLLGYCSTLLSESNGYRFHIDCGSLHRSLPVSPHCDNLLIQLPNITQAIVNPLVTEFHVDFCDQMFSQRFKFSIPADYDYIDISTDESNKRMSRTLFKEDILRLVNDFVAAIRSIDGSKLELPVFSEWYIAIATPLQI